MGQSPSRRLRFEWEVSPTEIRRVYWGVRADGSLDPTTGKMELSGRVNTTTDVTIEDEKDYAIKPSVIILVDSPLSAKLCAEFGHTIIQLERIATPKPIASPEEFFFRLTIEKRPNPVVRFFSCATRDICSYKIEPKELTHLPFLHRIWLVNPGVYWSNPEMTDTRPFPW